MSSLGISAPAPALARPSAPLAGPGGLLAPRERLRAARMSTFAAYHLEPSMRTYCAARLARVTSCRWLMET